MWTDARAREGVTRCLIKVWSALRRWIGGEAEPSPMCRCGHSAMCHWDETDSCRLIDYVTEAARACMGFPPATTSAVDRVP